MARKNRRRNKKQKWRQQKLAVGTVEKIAKRIATMQIEKDAENKWTTLQVGLGGNSQTPPAPVLIHTEGFCDAVLAVDYSNTFFSPNTRLAQVSAGGLPKAVESGEGYRIGDEVTVKGISFKGQLKLPALCAHARVTIKVVKFKAPLQQMPYKYFASLKYTGIRRELLEPHRAQVIKSVTYNLNHRAYDRDVTKQVDIYVDLKNKPIRYKEPGQLFNPLSCAIADFQDEFYMLVMFSDATFPPGGFQPPIATATANLYPHFYGRLVTYYQDG